MSSAKISTSPWTQMTMFFSAALAILCLISAIPSLAGYPFRFYDGGSFGLALVGLAVLAVLWLRVALLARRSIIAGRDRTYVIVVSFVNIGVWNYFAGTYAGFLPEALAVGVLISLAWNRAAPEDRMP